MEIKRILGLIFLSVAILVGIFIHRYEAIAISISPLMLLIHYKRIAHAWGYTDGILSFNGTIISGENNIIELQGCNPYKAGKNNFRIFMLITMTSLLLSMFTFGFSKIVSAFFAGTLISVEVLWRYLSQKDTLLESMMAGKTTIEVTGNPYGNYELGTTTIEVKP